jgi:hypothetical protein
VLKDLTTVKVANITIFILVTYDGLERVIAFDKKMIMGLLNISFPWQIQAQEETAIIS